MLTKKVFIFNENKIDNDFDLREYTHIRSYHGCCPIRLNDYYKKGIISINKEFALEQAIKLLSSDRISKDKVKKVFDSSWSNLVESHRYVWMILSREELIYECGHYLIYGSEFICSMAAELFCQDSLKGKGTPTIFHCDIPIESIVSGYIDDINEQIRNRDDSNCGFKLRDSLLPENIVKCEHPKMILDPLNMYEEYYPDYNSVV
jgi:hypothetical protein